jgi:hypothetical protein
MNVFIMRRHHESQRLRQDDDAAASASKTRPSASRGLDLALGQGLQAAADHLGQVGGGKQR